jgi:hypothetical protein
MWYTEKNDAALSVLHLCDRSRPESLVLSNTRQTWQRVSTSRCNRRCRKQSVRSPLLSFSCFAIPVILLVDMIVLPWVCYREDMTGDRCNKVKVSLAPGAVDFSTSTRRHNGICDLAYESPQPKLWRGDLTNMIFECRVVPNYIK